MQQQSQILFTMQHTPSAVLVVVTIVVDFHVFMYIFFQSTGNQTHTTAH